MDRGRAEVYAAERAAFEGTDLETIRPVDEIVQLIDTVTAGEWWPGPPVTAVAMRAGAESSCARLVAGRVEVRIARSQSTWATAAHEVAHALAGIEAGHGPRFRRALLDVVEHLTNTEVGARRGHVHVEQLANAFLAADLSVSERPWVRPVAADPFAL